MDVYRVAQEKFAGDLSGNGARLYGGRWNSEGLFALYTSESRSLALLETLVHTPYRQLQNNNYLLITISVPAAIFTSINPHDLKTGWDTAVASAFTKNIGDSFLQKNSKLLLKVPSVVVPEESNYVINPLHTAFSQVKIKSKRKLVFDNRVFDNL